MALGGVAVEALDLVEASRYAPIVTASVSLPAKAAKLSMSVSRLSSAVSHAASLSNIGVRSH
jgi:hypothetical protein